MQNLKFTLLIVATVLFFWFTKFVIGFPSLHSEDVGLILTIVSILFGLMAGFFISQLWSRYAEIRELQSRISADLITMTEYANNFYNNKKFKEEFIKAIEKAALADAIIDWQTVHLEIPYCKNIESSFKYINSNDKFASNYLGSMMNCFNDFIQSLVRADVLGKERLLLSEWFVMIALSAIIGISVLFLSIDLFFYKIAVLLYPVIIVLTLIILYKLDALLWSKNVVSLEPNQKVFDAIGVKRFYLKKKCQFFR